MHTENCKSVSRKFKGCFKEVLSVFQEISKKFQECFKAVLGKYQECFKKVSWVFRLRLKGVSSSFRGFKGI